MVPDSVIRAVMACCFLVAAMCAVRVMWLLAVDNPSAAVAGLGTGFLMVLLSNKAVGLARRIACSA